MGSEEIEAFRIKLKFATKSKFNIERRVCQFRNKEQYLNEQVAMLKADTFDLKEQLECVKNKIVKAKQQISIIKICSASEKSKIDGHSANLQKHILGFEHIFDKERDIFDIRMRELKEKEAEEEVIQRQKEKEIAAKNEREAMEAVAVKAECDALEKECAVLKKRNNAIMLQLRRKLLEAENTRRKLAKENA